MEVTVNTILMWFTSIVTTTLAIIIYFLGDKNHSTRLFSLLLLLSSFWSFLASINVSVNSSSTINALISLLLVKFAYFVSAIIASVFLLFSRAYLYYKSLEKRCYIIILIINSIFLYLIFLSNLIISKSTIYKF